MGKFCTMAQVWSFERAEVAGMGLTYYTADNRGGAYDGLDKALHGHCPREGRQVVGMIRRLANAGLVDLVQARDGDQTRYRAIWREHPCRADARPDLPSVAP